MIHGNLRRLIVSMPPRHGKSELVSRRLPAFLLGLNPKETIIACSYSAELASRMNRDIQRIMTGQAYNSLFPASRLSDGHVRSIAGSWLRNSDMFEVVEHGGTYRCAGVGGGITGMGARWIIVDDPIKNREEADSTTIREKIWDWYTSTLYTRQAPDARILVVMTRWHTEDLAGKLLMLADEKDTADKWEVIEFPAVALDPVRPPDERKPGEALWPEMFSLDDLERMRASMGEYQWAALYQQTPRAGGGVEWPEHYFDKGLMFDEWPETLQQKVIALDPSKGANAKHGDYSAIVKLGRTSDGTLWVEGDLARRSTEEIVSATVNAQMEWNADALVIEINQFQELLAAQIAARGREAGMPLPIVQVNNTVSKLVRIRRLGPYLFQKSFRFRNTPGTRLLVEQMKDFPVHAHDDGPDSLEMALRVMIQQHNSKAGLGGARRLKA
jgi:predicted phage terminase large subunit-like protein